MDEQFQGEIWARITDFPDYAISDLGRVMRLTSRGKAKAGHILTASPITKGYLQLKLQRDGESFPRRVHRLVAQHHIPNPFEKPEVNHRKADKTHNVSTNLEWATGEENHRHASVHRLRAVHTGKQICGSRQHCAHFTEHDVAVIRDRVMRGERQTDLSGEYRVSDSAISAIVNGKTWKHVPQPIAENKTPDWAGKILATA